MFEQKNAGESINSHLALVMKSGKYSLGYKSTLKSLRQGKGKHNNECRCVGVEWRLCEK